MYFVQSHLYPYHRGNCSPKRLWCPSDKNAPLCGAYRSRNLGKNTLNWTMLSTSLNFRIYMTDFDPAYYWLESTLPLCRNNTPVPLFLSRVRTAQKNKRVARSVSLAQFWTCRWAVQHWSVFVTSSFLMPGGSFERKSSGEMKIGMQQIWKTFNRRKILEACKVKNQFQVCYKCSPLVRSTSAS